MLPADLGWESKKQAAAHLINAVLVSDARFCRLLGKMIAKFRDFGLQKVPYILVLGDKEAAPGTASVRVRALGDRGSLSVEDFLARAHQLVSQHSMQLGWEPCS